ncbi:hypothetical protein [Nocardioides houyundeii]|uniref:hypothetical protein n=1 Tax=Nocardioides houyundeii TaxID=2045452 RepID=UPI001315862F|nr:hypothetical protein [Nocardioides houyundeii]
MKVIEAMAHGIPVIGTDFAFDGFPDEYQGKFVHVDLFTPDFHRLGPLVRFDPCGDRSLDIFKESFAIERVASLLKERQP